MSVASEPQDAEAQAQQLLNLTVQLPSEAAEDLNATILKFAQERGIRVETAIAPAVDACPRPHHQRACGEAAVTTAASPPL